MPDIKQQIVISLGGSLICPNDDIDVSFLKKFVEFILEYINKDFRFVIITGGGRLSRKYHQAAQAISNPLKEDLDWVGIAATKLNAELVRSLLHEHAHNKVILDPTLMPQSEKPIIVGGGWHPGSSSDFVAVQAALTVKANRVINLSNIDYAYDKDPKTSNDAKPIVKISWSEFRKLIPVEWEPNLNSPFDPIATQTAETLNLEVAIMNGNNIENLKQYLDGKEFIGTIIYA
jgi:uridylate kinase